MGMKTSPTSTEQDAKERVLVDKFSASICITGDGLNLEEISRTLGLTPTRIERGGGHKVKSSDLWLFQAPISSERPLNEHITALWDAVRSQIPYLRELKKKFQVDVLCVYVGAYFRGSFEVDHRCLSLFEELGVPFRIGVSVDLEPLIASTNISRASGGARSEKPFWQRWLNRIRQFWHPN